MPMSARQHPPRLRVLSGLPEVDRLHQHYVQRGESCVGVRVCPLAWPLLPSIFPLSLLGGGSARFDTTWSLALKRV